MIPEKRKPGGRFEASVEARKRIDMRTGFKYLNKDSNRSNLHKRYVALIVNQPTFEVLDWFQPEMLVIKQGDPIYNRRFASVFSAVTPLMKHEAWWQELLSRADDPVVRWLT